jgi:hypothetical protein
MNAPKTTMSPLIPRMQSTAQPSKSTKEEQVGPKRARSGAAANLSGRYRCHYISSKDILPKPIRQVMI